jgi:NADPH-dependent curcumin reductase CurA
MSVRKSRSSFDRPVGQFQFYPPCRAEVKASSDTGSPAEPTAQPVSQRCYGPAPESTAEEPSMTDVNHRLRLIARPRGVPTADDFRLDEEPVPVPGNGELVVQTELLSMDPAMRGWMDSAPSYAPPVGLGEVMRAIAGGRVVASRHPRFVVGDRVTGVMGVEAFSRSDGRGLRVVDITQAPLEDHLGILGGTGMTAYFGLFDVGRPRAGDTVVVSAAGGAVGSVTGQLAMLAGCRVIGIAGGPEKCRHIVEEHGFDTAIDYREPDIDATLAREAPNGVNVYFDNVGGDVLDAVLMHLAFGARIALCGLISQYNAPDGGRGPANYWQILVKRATVQGFLVTDYAPRYPEAVQRLNAWRATGALRHRTDVVDGSIGNFPDIFARLFSGSNVGKLLLRVAGEGR